MVPGETAAKITPIKDNQTAAAVDMSARDAAHHLVQKESHELKSKFPVTALMSPVVVPYKCNPVYNPL